MNNAHPIALFAPLAVGVVAFICTIAVHALPLSATVNFVSREKRLGRVGVSFWIDTGIVAGVMVFALVAHLVEMALWAVVYMMCGEFSDFATAFYHSAMNYTSLGYGDIIMSAAWKMLAPLETVDGMLLFGVSAAMVFAVIQRLVETRYSDLKD